MLLPLVLGKLLKSRIFYSDYMREKSCPKCGASSVKKAFFEEFCLDCYVKDHPGLIQIPERVLVEMCPTCLRINHKGTWVSGKDVNLEEYVKNKIKTQLENPVYVLETVKETPKHKIVHLNAEAKLGTGKFEIEADVQIKYDKNQCPVCIRKNSDFNDAIVQLRPKKTEADLDRIRSAANFLRNEARAIVKDHRAAELFRMQNVRNGVDVSFGSAKVAKLALQHMVKTYNNVEIKESYTLAGVHPNGKKRYKVTFSVRL